MPLAQYSSVSILAIRDPSLQAVSFSSMSAFSDPSLPIVSFSSLSATRGSSSADQSLPDVAFPREPTTRRRGARRRAGTLPTSWVESAVGDVRDPPDMPRAKVGSAVGDVCGAHAMDLPTVSVEAGWGGWGVWSGVGWGRWGCGVGG